MLVLQTLVTAGVILVVNEADKNASTTIAEDGKACAVIALREGAQEREREAASELQSYIKRSTGAKLPIKTATEVSSEYAIRLELAARSKDRPPGSFRIHVGEKETLISGCSPLAILYGAYEFLERFVGIRWYMPGPLGEIVPKHARIVLPMTDLEQSPSFAIRWVGEHNDRWMLRNKQNRCDDGLLIYPGIYHTQADLLPHEKYFTDHPEYFALINGKRSKDSHCKLCYSNLDLVREIARNMAAMLDENPDIDLISLSPTDGQLWCECGKCRAMDEQGVPRDRSKSRRSLIFYNAVAEELRNSHPEARILVGAYNVYNWPPKDEAIKADPMLNVIITHYEDYCLAHPVPDATCPRNERYVTLIDAWQNLGCKIAYYEYYWKLNWLDLPWPIVHSIREDMQWYKKRGHLGVYTQYNPDCIWSQYTAHYVAARLLWDVDVDVDAILENMYSDLYGEAAPHMKAYHELMENQMAMCGKHFPGRGPQFGPKVFTDEIRDKLRDHYEAANRENRDEIVARRLEKIGLSLEYTDRLMAFVAAKERALSEKDKEKAQTALREALTIGETLVTEIREERPKWAGVVSTDIVVEGMYLARDVARLKAQASSD